MNKILLYFKRYKVSFEYIVAEYISSKEIQISYYKRGVEYRSDGDWDFLGYRCVFKNQDAKKLVNVLVKTKQPDKFISKLKTKFKTHTALEDILAFADKFNIKYSCYSYSPDFNLESLPPNWIEYLYDAKGNLIIPELYVPPRNGIQKFYTREGSLRLKVSYANGKKNGLSIIYNGKKKEKEWNYLNGLRDGFFRTYHDNGKIKTEELFQNDKHNGYAREYFPNGKLKMHASFKNGLQVDWSETYDEKGRLKLKTEWKNGYADGIGISYHDNGAIKGKTPWEKGKKEGQVFYYYDSGDLYWTVNCKNDKDCGKQIQYYKNGNVELIRIWKNGLRVKTTEYWENGNKKAIWLYNKKGKLEGFSETYYKDGKLRTRVLYKDGQVEA